MSERPIKSEPNYATCHCEHCGGGIEFDASGCEKGEIRTVKCPHCNEKTSIFIEEHENRNGSQSPKQLSDFVGQNRVKARLELAIAAAKSRGEPLGHVLLIGSPGSGRATLANIINREMRANGRGISGAAIENASDLAGLLTNLEEGDVLFVEEIHRLKKSIEECLYPAMNDSKLDIIIDQGPNARSVRLYLPRFTLIGSTTEKDEISRGLLSCFQIVENMLGYNLEELTTIARRFAISYNVPIDDDAAKKIAQTADGTPLDVLNRLRHVRDYAHIKANGKINLAVAGAALTAR
jgi:Holliday junction DNA helicase RuvB